MITKKTPDDLKVILEELKEQCLETAKSIESMDLENKTEDEKDEILGDLSAKVAVLNIKSGLVENYLDEE